MRKRHIVSTTRDDACFEISVGSEKFFSFECEQLFIYLYAFI